MSAVILMFDRKPSDYIAAVRAKVPRSEAARIAREKRAARRPTSTDPKPPRSA